MRVSKTLIPLALVAASLTAMPGTSAAAPLQTAVFNPGKDAIFPVTSTLIYGPHEAMLVDAQFEKRHAAELIAQVRATGKAVKVIFISHSDPDYYFGLAELKKAFPGARVISTAQTAYLISATKDAKLQVWKDKLGPEAPTDLPVPEAAGSDTITIDDEQVVVRSLPDDPAHAYLWIPSAKTVLGGISVSTGEHLWMADTPSVAAIDAWLGVLDDMKKLGPEHVIAGHFLKPDQSPSQLDFVRDYLLAYRQAASTHRDAAGIVEAMAARYPALAGRDTLEFGAKVWTGQATWHLANPYPPIGKRAVVNFGAAKFELTFVDDKTMSFRDVSGAFDGVRDTVTYTPIEVSRNVFMVYWHEPSTGSNVVHLQDWNTHTVYTNIAAKDGSFIHLKGVIALDPNSR